MKKNIYIFSGDSFMVKKSVRELRKALDISNEELNVTDFKSMPKADELIAACAQVPFMSKYRLVIVSECSVLRAKGGAEQAKKIADNLEKIPDSTALVLCVDSADKRRGLYKKAKKMGEVKEFAEPRQADCINFIIEQADSLGVKISRQTAAELVSVSGCDYYTLENELKKLAVYCKKEAVTSEHIKQCCSKTLEYNVFEIHGLFVNKQAQKAKLMLDDILKSERPEMLIGLFARKIRDMYKAKMMINAGYSLDKIAGTLHVKNFVAQILYKECKRFSVSQLRNGLLLLADLDYSIKSGEKDASLALPEALVRIYSL